MNPKVSIIYLSYNSMPYFDKVVSSWKELDYPRESLEIIIVDNASSDRSADYIREKILPQSPPEAGQPLAVGTLPKITFIENKTNEGFAGGNNRGIKYALEQGCDYIYLHNNDLYLRPDALGEAIEAAQSDDFIGCVQSLMLLWQNPEFVNSSGNMIHFLGFGFTGDYKTRVADLNESGIKEIAYASCAAALFKSDVLKKVGLLDDFYWMYHEDLELGWRVRLAGYKNVVAFSSVAYHKYDFSRSIKKYFFMERNRFIAHLTHLKIGTIILILPAWILIEIGLIVASVKGGWIFEKLKSYAALMSPRTLQHIISKRRESKLLRKVTDREITRLFTGKILHQEELSPLVLYVMNPIFNAYWQVVKRLIRW